MFRMKRVLHMRIAWYTSLVMHAPFLAAHVQVIDAFVQVEAGCRIQVRLDEIVARPAGWLDVH